MAARRFVGANIDVPLFQAFEESRAEHGIGDRSQAIRAAIALWVNINPPAAGISKSVADLIDAITVSKSVREVMDQAVVEWRMSHSPDLLLRIVDLVSSKKYSYDIPSDILRAIEEWRESKT